MNQNSRFSSAASRPVARCGPRGLVLATGLALAAAGVAAQGTAPAASAASAATPAISLRAELAKPLQAAETAIKAGNYADALARLAEAEALPGLTPYERYIVQRLKGPAAFGAGDLTLALSSFEAALNSQSLPEADRQPLTEATIKLALQAKEYGRAVRWIKPYLAAGGSDAEIHKLYPQLLAVTGDHAGAVRELGQVLAADAAAGRSTPESTLRLLAGSQNQIKDSAGYLATLQKLAGQTGKADYWSELIARSTQRPGFDRERLRLEVYRLRRAVGVALDAAELGDMAQRANQAGLPAEAQALLDEGFGAGLLGKDANAAADQKLREQATRAAGQDRAALADSEAAALKAKDGNAAAGLGLALSAAGQHERALALLARGQALGGLKRPAEAQLHLGLALWRAGRIDEARARFAAVQGDDSVADLARLWGVYLASPTRK